MPGSLTIVTDARPGALLVLLVLFAFDRLVERREDVRRKDGLDLLFGSGQRRIRVRHDLRAELGVREELLELARDGSERRQGAWLIHEIRERGNAHRKRRTRRSEPGCRQRRHVRSRRRRAPDARRRRREPRLGPNGGTTGQRLHTPHERSDVDRPHEKRAALVRDRILDALDRSHPRSEVDEVDRTCPRKPAQAANLGERQLGVDVDQHDVRALDLRAGDEHRKRHIDDEVASRSQRVGDARALGRDIGHEDGGGPRGRATVLSRRSMRLVRLVGHPLPSLPLRLRRRVLVTPLREACCDPRKQPRYVDEPEDDRYENELSAGQAKDHHFLLALPEPQGGTCRGQPIVP